MAATLTVPTIFSAIDRMSGPLDSMSKKSKSFQDRLNSAGKAAGIGALAIAAPLAVALNSATTFEDKMADVAKTTQLEGKALESLGAFILDYSKGTRTSIDDLQEIAGIGGQLGIAEKDLQSFIKVSDQFNVAMGSDYSGGVEEAISQVGKIQGLFKETRGLEVADAMTKAGSTINDLGAKGKATTQNMNDFILRIGALPDALKPSFEATAALGALLEEQGIDSQIAASGYANLMKVAGDDLPGFAKQMGITVGEAKNLFNQDPTGFALKFSKSLNGMSATDASKTLKDLGINSVEVTKVVGALGSGFEKMGELQTISNKAFEAGTSLGAEYDTKNKTTAANLAKVKNNMEAFSIVIGTQLLPVVSELITHLTPLLQSFGEWLSNSPNLASNMLILSGILGGFWLTVKLISIWTTASSIAMGVFGAVSGAASIKIGANTTALAAYNVVQSLMTAGTWIATTAMTAWGVAMNLGLWPILAIIAAITAIIAIFYYWDEICAWFSEKWVQFTGFIGEVWNDVVGWFESFSFSDFFQEIGASIVDFLLFPLKSVLELIAMIPGSIGEAAKSSLDNLNTMTDFHVKSDENPALEPPQIAQQRALGESVQTQRNTIDMNINDPGKNVTGVTSNGPLNVPIKVTPTNDWSNGN